MCMHFVHAFRPSARRLLRRQATNTLLNASASMRCRANSGDQPLAAAMRACASADRPLARSAGRGGGCSGAGCAAAAAAGALLHRRRGCQQTQVITATRGWCGPLFAGGVALPACINLRNLLNHI